MHPASFPCQHGKRRVQTEESEKRCHFLCGGQSSVSDPEVRGCAGPPDAARSAAANLACDSCCDGSPLRTARRCRRAPAPSQPGCVTGGDGPAFRPTSRSETRPPRLPPPLLLSGAPDEPQTPSRSDRPPRPPTINHRSVDAIRCGMGGGRGLRGGRSAESRADT